MVDISAIIFYFLVRDPQGGGAPVEYTNSLVDILEKVEVNYIRSFFLFSC